MKYADNKGFTLVETLIGFILFSMMMMIYLPGFYQEMMRNQIEQEKTFQWKLVSDLAQASCNSHKEEGVVEDIVNLYNQTHTSEAITYHVDLSKVWIQFEDGSELDVTKK